MPGSSLHELRCDLCGKKPLLALYGRDRFGKLFVHVKVYKQKRVFAEMIVTSGRVRLKCRECLRWHTVTIRQPSAVDFKPEDLPSSLPIR